MRSTPHLLGLTLLIGLVGCSNGQVRADLTITAPLAGAPNAAVHGTVIAPDDDQLVAATSPACGSMELHESFTDAEGRHVMRDIRTIELPGGHDVRLDAGGLHVMCLDVDPELVPGDTVAITLTLASGSTAETSAEVVTHGGHDH